MSLHVEIRCERNETLRATLTRVAADFEGRAATAAPVSVLVIETRKEAEELLSRPAHDAVFTIVVLGEDVRYDPKLRLWCFQHGANMVTETAEVGEVLARLTEQFTIEGDYSCPQCGLSGLTEDALHLHFPLYHSTTGNIDTTCPVCQAKCRAKRGGFDVTDCTIDTALAHDSQIFTLSQVHMHNCHGPMGEREPPRPNYNAFAWVVCRRPSDGRFVMVNEPAGMNS